MNRRSCRGCIYHRTLTDEVRGKKYCNFMLDTGEKRGCSPVNCTRYTKGELPKRKVQPIV